MSGKLALSEMPHKRLEDDSIMLTVLSFMTMSVFGNVIQHVNYHSHCVVDPGNS